MSDLASKIGSMIKELRLEKGWNQNELAKYADIHTAYVGQLERGEKNASVAVLDKIFSTLGGDWLVMMHNLSHKSQIDPIVLNSLLSLLSSYSKEEQKELLSAILTLVKLMNGKSMIERERKNRR